MASLSASSSTSASFFYACKYKVASTEPNRLIKKLPLPTSSYFFGQGLSIAKERHTEVVRIMKKDSRGKIQISASSGLMEETKSAAQSDMIVVDVDLGDRSYPIYIGTYLLDRPELLQRLAIFFDVEFMAQYNILEIHKF